MSTVFNYNEAFSRNIGWVTENEQQVLRHKRVAIAGMGGVGGSHLLTLTRLGITQFNIADFDVFEVANFNRQAGATMSHLEKPKVDMLADMALDINPELNLQRFPNGVSVENLHEFFKDVDVYVDGLDFFVFEIRQAVFKYCHEHGIPAVTAAPLGMGTALLNFMPGKMSFEDYFGFADHSAIEKGVRFLVGLAPAGVHGKALVDPKTLDIDNQKGPSTPMGCELCAGAAASQVLKILLNRGPVLAAPHGFQFDAYSNKMVHTWRPGGHKNPLQKQLLKLARAHFSADSKAEQPVPAPQTLLEKIINTARWAPSGDNTQPWRFEIITDTHLVVHGNDTRDECVYDLHGHPSQMAIGALLETLHIAASEFALVARIERRKKMPVTSPTFDIYFEKNPQQEAVNPLLPYIPHRTVQRRAMAKTRLTAVQKQKLFDALGDNYDVLWLDDKEAIDSAAMLMFKNAKIRLTIPEAYEVHREVIEWESDFSVDKVPAKAIGLDPVATKMMRWALQSWERVKFMNTYLAGTVLPRIQLDLIPGKNCAAHFVLIANQQAESIDDYVAAGRAMQRFWLTATKLGLQLQPEMTPLIFSSYIRERIHFTDVASANQLAANLYIELQQLVGETQAQNAVFMGRIGHANRAKSRSIRLSFDKLFYNSSVG